MAFPIKLLNDNESIIIDLRPHWVRLLFPIVEFILFTISGIVLIKTTPLSASSPLILLVALFEVIRLTRACVHRGSEGLIVTTERIIHRTGVFRKNSLEIPLARVNTVTVDQSLLESLYASGTVSVEYIRGEGLRKEFHQFPQPVWIQKEITHAIERLRSE